MNYIINFIRFNVLLKLN